MIDPDDERTPTERELTMLIQRLVRIIRKTDPNSDAAHRAIDYIARKQLTRVTDILR